MAAAVELGEGSCALEEEIELLEAIYIHELTVEGPRERPTSVSVSLHPSTADEEHKRFVCLTLVLVLPQKYPHDLPSICIKTPRGLSEAHVSSILSNLRELAGSCIGRPMLYELIEYAKDCLTDNNVPSCVCAICLCHFQDSDEFTKTDCYHYFHCGCLARYIKFSLEQEKTDEDENKVECPMCRLPISYNLTDLQGVALTEVNKDEFVYKPSEEIRKLQKKMASLFEKQKRKGGVIDIEQERNRYLIDITSVRQEESVKYSPPSGLQTDATKTIPIADFSAGSVPKGSGKSKEFRESMNSNQNPERKDRKKFSKNSPPHRGSRRPLNNSRDKFKGDKRENNASGDERPKSTVKAVGLAIGSKESDLQEKEVSPSLNAKQVNFQAKTEHDQGTGRVIKRKDFGVACDRPGSKGERPSSARRGRGKTERGRTWGERKSDFRDERRDWNKNSPASQLPVKQISETGITKGSMRKPSVRLDGDSNPSRHTISSVGSIEETLEKRPEIGANSSHKNGEGTLVNEFSSSKEATNSRNSKSKARIPPPGFESVVVGTGGCNQSRNEIQSEGNQRSAQPRPPPGLITPAKRRDSGTSQYVSTLTNSLALEEFKSPRRTSKRSNES